MDFFKSVFSEPSPSPSPPTTPTSPNPSPAPSWGIGSSLLKTIASKSESLIDNYYKDLQEFSSGIKKETSVIRQAATRAVQDLPARLESGAAIAQESLEAVGQAIDNVGSTVSDIIGKDLNFASNDSHLDQGDDDNSVGISDSRDAELGFSASVKPYSRIDAMVRAVQCDIRTYIDEVEESGYADWRLGFVLEERRGEIEGLLGEDGAVAEIYGEVVPVKVDEETFWCRYFYRVDRVVRAEEARLRMVKRAISGEEEEELSWDVDDDDDDEDNGECRFRDELKEGEVVEEKGKGVEGLGDGDEEKEGGRDGEGGGVSGVKGENESLGGRSVCNEKEASSDGKLGSDISIISSQRSSHADDLGWDEIEDIRSVDESNVDLGKKLVAEEEDDEELTWDIEDDDDHHV
ncbi:hypothetical protein SASPL_112330 [Salvia splendens]|uniref:BSD domain-containing protein n=1 Tax=Salvia splendens TaxID=180675 RepID=A0A8X9A563_SALSN|nr:protein DOS2-like [Salvia splendens]KAG6428081.1 hypothetical protein SASPL_112330 [Salvia splendens]